jgi:hypothetical protein
MSQFTFATLVKEDKQTIASYLEKNKTSSYLFSVNANWCAVIVEDDMQLAAQTAEEMSTALDTFALYFFDCEDHGWGFSLFLRGQLKSECYVDYEDLVISFENSALYEECADQEAYMIFRRWVKNFYDDADEILNGVHLFKKAFAMEKIEWISYEYLSSDLDERLDQLQVQYFRG